MALAGYGGLVPEKRAKDRSAYDDSTDPADLIEARAVFPWNCSNRWRDPQAALARPVTQASDAHADLSLRGVVYCAHCEAQAKAQDNPGLRG